MNEIENPLDHGPHGVPQDSPPARKPRPSGAVFGNKMSWFTTEIGRKFVFGSICCTGVGLISASFLPNTVFLDKYKEIVQAYSFGVPKPLPVAVKNRYDKALEMLDIPEHKQKILKPFTVFGFDVFNAGTTWSKWGALIGIPDNFSYTSSDLSGKADILVRNKPVDWNSEDGRRLSKALYLTEDEQVFAISRELLTAESPKKLLNTIYPAATLGFAYSLASYLNHKLHLFERQFQVRGVMYSIVGCFSMGLYFLAKDFTEVYYETQVDKKLCELGPKMIQSGVNFYDKTLTRNIALRNLVGDGTYSALGNENYFLRQKHLPISVRKSYFQMRLDELSNKNR